MATVRPKSTTKAPARKPKTGAQRLKMSARKVTASAHRFSASAKKVTAGARRLTSSARKTTASAHRLKVTAHKAAAPARKAKTPARHSWLYELRSGGKVVFYGVAGTREPSSIQRSNSGKGFSQVKVLSLALTRASAMKRSMEHVEMFQKRNGGHPPKYNTRAPLAA
jgi:hypothetical protein